MIVVWQPTSAFCPTRFARGRRCALYQDAYMKLICISIAAILILVVIFLAIVTFPLDRDKYIKPLFQAKPGDVVSIKIEPFKHVKLNDNIIKEPLTIRDPNRIREICSGLNEAKPWNPGHPISKWSAVLVLEKTDGVFYCEVSRLIHHEMGVYIVIQSRREWGWHIGSYRSDSLGDAIEAIVGYKESN